VNLVFTIVLVALMLDI